MARREEKHEKTQGHSHKFVSSTKNVGNGSHSGNMSGSKGRLLLLHRKTEDDDDRCEEIMREKVTWEKLHPKGAESAIKSI